MKAWSIALFLMFISITAGLVADLGVLDVQYAMPVEQEAWFEDAKKTSFEEDITLFSAVENVLRATKMFIDMIKDALYIAGTLMNTFRVPTVLAVIIQAGIWVTYVIAGIQIFLGKSLKGYE